MSSRLLPSLRGTEPETRGQGGNQHATGAFTITPRQKSLEIALLALVIALAAGVVWGVIQLAFPRGAPLPEPVADVSEAAAVRSVPAEVPKEPAAPAVDFEGVLATIRRTVQVRAGGELTWGKAEVGRALHVADGIQTLAAASAVVKVKGQGDIRIGENSLVVFEANSGDSFLSARTAVATVDHGELNGRLTAGADRDALGLRLPNATIRVQGARAGQAADFRLQVNEDKSAAVVILRGQAQVRARNGTRRLGSGEGVRISADGRNVEVQSIPPVPELVEPGAGQVVTYHKDLPKVAFRWRSAAPADDYRFVLAGDREFRNVLVDERVSDAVYTHAGLKTGEYYWKVSGRRGWLESSATDAAGLRVERDIDARVRDALADLYQHSAAAQKLVDQAKGVLVFPNVIKGGIILGGEYGEGALLAEGHTVDYYTVTSASLGLQLGGQTRKVVLLFMTPESYGAFVNSSGWKVGVDGSVALAALGAGKAIDSTTAQKPIIGFVFSNKGLMYNLTLEGSKISRMQ